MDGRVSRTRNSAHPPLPLLLLVLLLDAAASSASDTREPLAPGVELAVRRPAPGMVAARVSLGGEDVWMLVDTGATRSRIDSSIAARLELRPRARYPLLGLDGHERLALCGPATIVLGALGGVEAKVDCLAWSNDLAVPLGLDGVLGADALAQADVLLDTESGRMRVAPAGALRPWVEGVAMQALLLAGRPAVAARWSERDSGAAGFLVLDSGADVAILFDGAAAASLSSVPHRESGPRLRVETTGATITAATIRLLSLQMGSLRLEARNALLLPGAELRDELGVLPVAAFGPTLFALRDGLVVAGARLRLEPREAPLQVAAVAKLRYAP